MPKTSGEISKPVFIGSSLVIFSLVIAGIVDHESLQALFSDLQAGIITQFSWFYILAMTGFLVFAVYLLFSPYAHIRLGKDHDRPEFSYLSWLSMLFSAGMGIGLLFYGVAEPLFHFQAPIGSEPETIDAAREAMALTYLHWGFHPWACYSVVALILAYFGFRKDLPFSLRSAFYPLLKKRIYGFWGHLVDGLAIVSTLFGVATSLGLGAMQINSGLAYRFGLEMNTTSQIFIIAFVTLAATVSVVTGLRGGIRRLSEANMIIALILTVFVFVMGSTTNLISSFVQNLGEYLQVLPKSSFWTGAYDSKSSEWLGSWTVFYWAWWIAWSPFVGIFIARISKGRTIREFLIGVLVAPCLIAFAWFTIFGNSAIDIAQQDGNTLIQAVNEDLSSSLFVFLESFPFTQLMGGLATICIALFFVTSSDSASLVIHTLASGGSTKPATKMKIYWAVLEGLVAAVLLVVGGLKALQTASITVALPFTVLTIIAAVCFLKALKTDMK
jgi:choline/glycine/proline betaine transport protein